MFQESLKQPAHQQGLALPAVEVRQEFHEAFGHDCLIDGEDCRQDLAVAVDRRRIGDAVLLDKGRCVDCRLFVGGNYQTDRLPPTGGLARTKQWVVAG